jgi:hypothetical protein
MKHKSKVVAFRMTEHDHQLLQHYCEALGYKTMTDGLNSLLTYGVLHDVGVKQMKKAEAKAKRQAKKEAASGL